MVLAVEELRSVDGDEEPARAVLLADKLSKLEPETLVTTRFSG